jgi:antirestriction protein ArdC
MVLPSVQERPPSIRIAIQAIRYDTNGDDASSIDYRPAEEAIEAASDGMGVGLRYGGGRAFYSPAQDSIQVPHRATFDGPEEFYATVFHELIHATEHHTRLN